MFRDYNDYIADAQAKIDLVLETNLSLTCKFEYLHIQYFTPLFVHSRETPRHALEGTNSKIFAA